MPSWFVIMLVKFTIVTLISASAKKRNDEAVSDDTCGRGVPTPLTFMNRSCYYVESPDALPYADGGIFFFPENSIFFLETSCKGGLSLREACSIESAARAHPNRHIVVLFIGPVHKNCLEDEPMTSLQTYQNVKFYRIHLHKYVEGTPLESIFVSERFNRSRYPVYHTSSLLRFLTLYKYGGIYLDLDVLVLKSFDELPEPKDWVGLEDDQGREVGASLISASTEGIGRVLIDTAINMLKKEYNLLSWIHDTGNVIKNALRTICSTPMLQKMSSETCQGFSVYPFDYFYQLHVKYKRERFFDNGYRYTLKDAFAIHLMHSVTNKNVIFENSTFGRLISGFCPLIHLNTELISDVEIMGQSTKSDINYKRRTTTSKVTRADFLKNPKKWVNVTINLSYQSTTELEDQPISEFNWKDLSTELQQDTDDNINTSESNNATEAVHLAINPNTTEELNNDVDESIGQLDNTSPTGWTLEEFYENNLTSDFSTANNKITDIMWFINPHKFKNYYIIINDAEIKEKKIMKSKGKNTTTNYDVHRYPEKVLHKSQPSSENSLVDKQYKQQMLFLRPSKLKHIDINTKSTKGNIIRKKSELRRMKKKKATMTKKTTSKILELSTTKYEFFWRREQYPSVRKAEPYSNKFAALMGRCK